jgi:hypothetical protein
LETNFEYTPNRGWITDKPSKFKREFSVALARLIYTLGSELEIVWGIKSAMRKLGAGMGMERD